MEPLIQDTHLEIENLSYAYGRKDMQDWSLKGINLHINKGELLGLLGPSGCGKTTLLRLIAGFENPMTGSIAIGGALVANEKFVLPPERRGIGMVFQDYALFPHLDAWKNVCFGLRRGDDKTRALWILDLLGLSDFLKRYPHELSGGQRQRLALARALAPGTSLVLLDEPFSNLDVEVRLRLRSELSQVLNSCSATGLLVTHDPQEALAICDRVAVMEAGKIHQCSSPYDLVNKPQTSFVARFLTHRNVIPAISVNGKLWTPIGQIPKPVNSNISDKLELFIPEDALLASYNVDGNAVVIGREFCGSYWLLRVKTSTYILRIWNSLEYPLEVDDHCDIKFRVGSNGLLFPGSISCKLLEKE